MLIDKRPIQIPPDEMKGEVFENCNSKNTQAQSDKSDTALKSESDVETCEETTTNTEGFKTIEERQEEQLKRHVDRMNRDARLLYESM